MDLNCDDVCLAVNNAKRSLFIFEKNVVMSNQFVRVFDIDATLVCAQVCAFSPRKITSKMINSSRLLC